MKQSLFSLAVIRSKMPTYLNWFCITYLNERNYERVKYQGIARLYIMLHPLYHRTVCFDPRR